MSKKTVYICDPEKNTACSKECCKMFRICRATTNIHFAKLDENGKPIVADRSVKWEDDQLANLPQSSCFSTTRTYKE